jgi:CBS domain-containing protein
MMFALELTQDFNILPGLLIACIAAHGVTVLLLRRSILTEKVARRGMHVAREYSIDPLTVVRVGEVMEENVVTIPAGMKLAELSDRIARHEAGIADHEGLPIVDERRRLAGIITRGDVLRAIGRKPPDGMTVLEAGSSKLVVAYPDELLHEAVGKMLRHNVGRLPVVRREDPGLLVGYLGRSNLMEARLRRMEEEHVRARGLTTA